MATVLASPNERTNRRYEARPLSSSRQPVIDSALTVAGCSHYPTAFADEVELGGPKAPLCPMSVRGQPPLTHTGSGRHFCRKRA